MTRILCSRSTSIRIENSLHGGSPAIRDRNWSIRVNATLGPEMRNAPGSYGASSVCLRSNSGCRILDFPELFAPQRSVNRRMLISRGSAIDLYPDTKIEVMPFTDFFCLRHFQTHPFPFWCADDNGRLQHKVSQNDSKRGGCCLFPRGLAARTRLCPPWQATAPIIYPATCSTACLRPDRASAAACRPGIKVLLCPERRGLVDPGTLV